MQEPASVMNPEPHEAETPQPAEGGRRRGPMKFAYASGSRPLEGYAIKRGIGAGGFGDVYYAISDAGKEVALKRIQRNLDVELRGVSQCLNLKHPNLVSLYDIRYDDGEQAWVVMEYVAGESLQDVIERNPNGMPEDEVESWFEGIVDGVTYLHEHGIVHRDLKPGNIFLDQGTVKIGDYGLSKFISCSRRSGQTESVGTFHYMAPEIGLGRYGKEIDVYALGILLYEMLTGHVPFEGESSQEIIMKHLTAQPDLSRVPPRYRVIISRAMAKDPADRFGSAAEMRDRLQVENTAARLADTVAVPPRFSSATPPPPPPPGSQDRVRTPWHGQAKVEPIGATVRNRLHQFRSWWRQQNSLTRAIVAIALTAFVVANSYWLFGAMFTLVVVYACYYLLWSLLNGSYHLAPPPAPVEPRAAATIQPVRAEVAAPQPPTSTPPPTANPVPRRRNLTRQQLSDAMRNALGRKSRFRQLSELSGSMLMAAFVVAVIALPMTAIASQNATGDWRSWGPLYAWLTVVSLTASWILLGLGKAWEGSNGDPALRRFGLLVAGMAVGCIASLMAYGLKLEPIYLLGNWQDHRDALGADVPVLYRVTGEPRTLAYVGYFGGLFLILRWWLATDPLRNFRLNVFGTAVTWGMALLAYLVLPIPRGFLVIATVSVAVQLAATWVPPSKREEFKERLLLNERTS